MPESEDKGYTVKDRRFHQLSEEEKAEARETGSPQEQAFQEAARRLPPGPSRGRK